MTIARFQLCLRAGLLATVALAGARVRAADLLRSGRAASAAASGSESRAAAALAGAVPRPSGTDSLARTTQALQAVQAMQAAARSLAMAGPANLGRDPNHVGVSLPNVPDGLVAGGLKLDLTVPPSGANAPTQTTASGKTEVTVTQTAQQALLTWESFNVGKNTTLTFDQSLGGDRVSEWITFNQVKDPSGVPSQILGSIQAPGQVYLINQNGIIFGGSAQVNTHALVASSLPINTNLVARGLLNNPDQQFLFSSLPVAAGANGMPAFNPVAALTPSGGGGDVVVQPGARLASPTSAEHVGGRIALLGPNVTNAGTISTPDGQTILAAGQQVGLAAHDGSDPTLRGLDVFVGAGGGTATNAENALIESPRGAVTVVARAIEQRGAVASSTSVAFNGRLDLLAEHDAVSSGGYSGLPAFFPRQTGTVTFGPGSLTQVLPELASTERVVGRELALQSQVNVRGQSVYLAPNALLVAPSAALKLEAGTWNLNGGGATAQDYFAFTGGNIYLDSGAVIDVAGSAGVAAAVTDNIVAVELRGAELANSPLQRDGPLRGQTIKIDLRQTGTYNGQAWIGTPLADTTGYVALVDHTVGQLTTAGGSVQLSAGSAVVLQPGSTVNVSGGWINYTGGDVATSKVLADGRVLDIALATPDRVYDGLYQGATTSANSKWGVTSTTVNPALEATYEPGYVQGGTGGSLAITAPAVALDGTLLGATVAGPRQRTAVPPASSLSLAVQAQDPALAQNFFPLYSPTPPAITFRSGTTLPAVGAFDPIFFQMPEARQREIMLSPELLGPGAFGALAINNRDGNINVPAGVALAAPAGGAITLAAANLDVQGRLRAPGGDIALTAYDRSPYADRALTGGALPPPPQIDPARGRITLGPQAAVEVGGLVIDDRTGAAAAAENTFYVTQGGTVSLSGFNVELQAGSRVEASGGVRVGPTGQPNYGVGGAIIVQGGQDPGFASLTGGSLSLSGELSAYGGTRGGSLTLLAPAVQVSGTTSDRGTLQLAPEFFSLGGFANFSVGGLGVPTATPGEYLPAVVIAPGTTLAPVAQNRVLADQGPQLSFTKLVAPEGVRAPVSVAFNAVGVRDPFNSAKPVIVRGDLVLGEGATIRVDPKGAVILAGDTVQVLGAVSAPGGSISVTGAKDSTLFFPNQSLALPTVQLGPRSSLTAAGATVLIPDPRGLRTGTVLAGGRIAVAGNIYAEAGARFDVSGTAGVLDLAPSYSLLGATLNTSTSGQLFVPTGIESNGGSITFTGAQGLWSDATLRGAAGGPSALGGSLTVTAGRFYPPGTSATAQTPRDVTLTVSQSGPTIAPQSRPAGQSPIGTPVIDAGGAPLAGQGYFSADTFNQGGFDALTLRGTVEFAGPVTIHAGRSLTVGTSGVLFAEAAVALDAPYVALGAPFLTPLLAVEQGSAFLVQGQPFYAPPTYGGGTLKVSGQLIDVGSLSLQNIGAAALIAEGGDIRGNGTLDLAGDLTLRAGQIYPPTDLSFTLAAYDYQRAGTRQPGTVTISSAGTRQTPLSAAGTLNIFGSTITQGGVLRAPMGTINLGWDGTGTAPRDLVSNLTVAATQQLTLGAGSVTSVATVDAKTGAALVVPYGANLNGTAWIDPASNDITATGLPAKAVNISASNVTDEAGSVIDLRGGGDLYAYRFVPGVGGTRDVLAATTSFAVLPNYEADYAPYAPFNATRLNPNLGNDAGYVNASLRPGDRVTLAASNGLPAGTYTLLPARYALLPGAFLVTPQGAAVPPLSATEQPDGSSVVAGYRTNALSGQGGTQAVTSAFQVTPQTVVRQRAEYEDSLANTTLRDPTTTPEVAVARLPVDAGQLVISAARNLTLQGTVNAQAPTGGRGGLVDLSSPSDIIIAGARGVTAPAGTLVLSATELTAFGAESLLIGGVRTTASTGTTVGVKTGNLTLDNAGSALRGADVILAANRAVTLAPGAVLDGAGVLAGASDRLLLGSATTSGSGDGALVRASSASSAEIVRAGVSSTATPSLTVGAGVRISGGSVTLDSTRTTVLDPSAVLAVGALALDSGQITLQLAGASAPTTGGLLLSGAALDGLQSAASLSLLSYSAIDIYGSGQLGALDAGGRPTFASLALHAGQIRGDGVGGSVTIAAKDILLDNAAGGSVLAAGAATAGTLNFIGDSLKLGANPLAIDQFSATTFDARNGVIGQGTGSLSVQGALTIRAPLLTGATGSSHTIVSGGELVLTGSGAAATTSLIGGLGASLALSGSTVTVATNLLFPSGTLELRAITGDLQIGTGPAARLDVGGTAQTFFDVTKFTPGGDVTLAADAGNTILGPGSVVTVAAAAGGGAAGSISVRAPAGEFTAGGALLGAGGAFSLEVGGVAGDSLSALNDLLNRGGFDARRSFRVRTGDAVLDGTATAREFLLSTDRGSIRVGGTGLVDASGPTGGSIALAAAAGVTLEPGARLTVAAADFDAAGKGGSVTLETRGEIGAMIDLQAGSTVDLAVASNDAGSAALGRFSGTLHLRAPQTAGAADVSIAPLHGTVRGASAVVVEGFQVTDLTTAGEAPITPAVMTAVQANGTAFTANTAAITLRLTTPQPDLGAQLHVQPGAEIINRSGDLTLAQTWDLSTFRFGPNHAEPGVLTLRAGGNLNFDYSYSSITRVARIGSLSDGFGGASTNGLWTAPLLEAGTASWSYRLVAGADFSAADFRRVQPLDQLAGTAGSLLLGRNAPPLPIPSNPNSPNAASNLRETILPNFFQTIRTGTGDIDIAAGRDVQFLNPIATVYTAGTGAAPLPNFDPPVLDDAIRNSKLGQTQNPIYPAYYTYGGGNISVAAQHDITHLVLGNSGLAPDSSKELPTNWLYRRGYVDPVTGQFAATRSGGDVASTSWWVDFSNFFEGVGALGGGNVSLQAGRDIANVDAAVATNGRMPQGAPDAAALIELGGGNLTVRAGRHIDGGVYYVERGQGDLSAGGSIRTNSTRAALKQSDVVALETRNAVADATTWLPTTLFLGQGSFDVSARGDVLLGPVVNAFLLPQGVNNSAFQKTYFSTYAASSAVAVASLTGTLTLRASPDGRAGSLANWYENVLLYDDARHQTFSSYSQPWLRLLETDITPFYGVTGLLPGTLRATAFAGDLNLVGGLTLSPAASGTLDLLAAKAVNGMQVNGVNSTTNNRVWGASQVILSDADPRRIPGVAAPLALSREEAAAPTVTPIELLDAVNVLFNESGSSTGLFAVIQTKQALHAAGPLHLNDAQPLHLYARGGDISGLTLFSAKAARVVAGRDITDISLYLQNTRASDVSVVAAARDLVAFNQNSPLRLVAQSSGNELLQSSVTTPAPGGGNPNAGDIQIAGPGTLEVLAGRDFDLGVGPTVGDGTGIGITSVGNARNPNLPFAGAGILAGAGLGPVAGLDASALDFARFERTFLNPATAGDNATRYLPLVGEALNLGRVTTEQAWSQFSQLSAERRQRAILDVFYRVLREAGRDHGNPASPDYQTYAAGFEAVAALFPGAKWHGDFSLTSREIKTASGGDIQLFAPGGQLTVGFDVAGSQPVDQGILTESGGNIFIFTHGSVIVGTSRIFTLRGGNEIIWSSAGNIAAGASSKTVQSAPPTRVLVDPQSADVKTDLAGLATGGGIGVLATVSGVAPGDVDLIAPTGTIDAGDAGIRVSGNLNISALQVVNAANIQVSGSSVGTPTVAAPAIGGLLSASASTSAASSVAQEIAKVARTAAQAEESPSLITVEVLGYGGASDEPEPEP